jgi:sterol-4alpha-carboxylate 3-dehydrogenase (decarboxylating)
MAPATKHLLGPVLVTGGCGFLGWHLVGLLLSDPTCTAVHVVDRAVSKNLHPRALYHQANIADRSAIAKVFASVQPRVVFHLASPNFSFDGRKHSTFFEGNVTGTEVMLAEAAACAATKAFVNCSSVDIYSHGEHKMITEAHPTRTADISDAYGQTKALADALVLAANGPQLKTTTLRIAHMYGSRCSQQLQVLLDMSTGTNPLFQIGDGTNLVSVVEGGNASMAHVQAAKALLDPKLAKGKVDGEAFNIAEAEVPFWDHTYMFWSAARGRDISGEVLRIPAWVARALWAVVIWGYWIFTLGMLTPPSQFNDTALSYAIQDRTYSPEKFNQRVGWKPVVKMEEKIRESVFEELKRRETLKTSK